MPKESLNDLTARLRSELASSGNLDQRTRDDLQRLVQDVESAVQERSKPSPEHAAGLRERLDDWIRELEASHPTLATRLGSIVDTLAFYNL
jgi:ElaB/YqjD/DUF883 family membrane-anchored ribosome-binding protein